MFKQSRAAKPLNLRREILNLHFDFLCFTLPLCCLSFVFKSSRIITLVKAQTTICPFVQRKAVSPTNNIEYGIKCVAKLK